MLARGIDISSYQGEIDFQKVKQAGYSFVIIKAGQGEKEMYTFRNVYLPAVLAAGLDWGAYWWSDAVTPEEAEREARLFANSLKGLKPTYPVWMDQEYGSPHQHCTRQERTRMVKAFLKAMEKSGFYAGLYCSYDWLENWLIPDQLKAYDKWIAQYSSECSLPDAGIWQYTVLGTIGRRGVDYQTVGRVPGVAANCDVDYAYKDYPQIIKSTGLNGWGKKEIDYKSKYFSLMKKLSEIVESEG